MSTAGRGCSLRWLAGQRSPFYVGIDTYAQKPNLNTRPDTEEETPHGGEEVKKCFPHHHTPRCRSTSKLLLLHAGYLCTYILSGLETRHKRKSGIPTSYRRPPETGVGKKCRRGCLLPPPRTTYIISTGDIRVPSTSQISGRQNNNDDVRPLSRSSSFIYYIPKEQKKRFAKRPRRKGGRI